MIYSDKMLNEFLQREEKAISIIKKRKAGEKGSIDSLSSNISYLYLSFLIFEKVIYTVVYW